ncbi:hypothetical protein LPB41_02595 [Thalassospira sp. MA62]|nr:hypothetical protein [Thalassospira sp. MA62]
MTEFQLNVSGHKIDAPFVKGGPDDAVAAEMLQRQRDFLRSQLQSDPEKQLAIQNAQPVHTAFRLNGKLVGTIGLESGFTSTGISDGGAYQQAQNAADQLGLKGTDRYDYVADQVAQALRDKYGASLDVVTYPPDERPTTGELHAEMFGGKQPVFEKPFKENDGVAYLKFFAQMYAQKFGEDPFAGLDVPFDT